MDASKFKNGDKVRWRFDAKAPTMFVIKVLVKKETVECSWFGSTGEFFTKEFHADSLEPASVKPVAKMTGPTGSPVARPGMQNL